MNNSIASCEEGGYKDFQSDDVGTSIVSRLTQSRSRASWKKRAAMSQYVDGRNEE